jgi:hypothetical protein
MVYCFILSREYSIRNACNTTGLAASTLLVVNGDILGFSGIISSVTTAPKKAFSSTSQQWKIVFVSAFLITSNLFANFAPQSYTKIDSASQNHSISSISYVLAAGGFLVGFGTKVSWDNKNKQEGGAYSLISNIQPGILDAHSYHH